MEQSSIKKLHRLGYLGTWEDAPLLVAQAHGWFADAGLAVDLCRELGNASLAAKLHAGQLSAANVPALFPAVSALQRPGQPVAPAVAVTSWGGLSLTLTVAVAELLKARQRPERPVRIGLDAPRGDGVLLLRAWQATLGVGPADLTLVPVAISQFLDFLQEDFLQGMCAPEPITSMAEDRGLGLTVARSQDFFPAHPRTTLAVHALTALHDPGLGEKLAQVLRRAGQFCARAENWPALQKILLAHASPWPAAPGSPSRPETQLHHLPKHLLYRRPTWPDDKLQRGDLDFLRRACAATDVTWREPQIIESLHKTYATLLPPELAKPCAGQLTTLEDSLVERL